LIPGINDSDDNLIKSAEMLRKLGLVELEFIPYHEFAFEKNVLIGRDYVLRDMKPYTSEILEQKTQVMAKHGIEAKIGV
jgi:pyruvate formate lyase activating enzyme